MTRPTHRPAAFIDIHVAPGDRAAPIFDNPTRLPAALYALWRPGPEQAGDLVIHTGAPMFMGYGSTIGTVARIRPRCARGRHGVTGWALVWQDGHYRDLRVLVCRRRAQALRLARAMLTPPRWEDDGPIEWVNDGTAAGRSPGVLLDHERDLWVQRTPGAYFGPSGAIHFFNDEDDDT